MDRYMVQSIPRSINKVGFMFITERRQYLDKENKHRRKYLHGVKIWTKECKDKEKGVSRSLKGVTFFYWYCCYCFLSFDSFDSVRRNTDRRQINKMTKSKIFRCKLQLYVGVGCEALNYLSSHKSSALRWRRGSLNCVTHSGELWLWQCCRCNRWGSMDTRLKRPEPRDGNEKLWFPYI